MLLMCYKHCNYSNNEQISQNPRRVMHILVLGPGLEQL